MYHNTNDKPLAETFYHPHFTYTVEPQRKPGSPYICTVWPQYYKTWGLSFRMPPSLPAGTPQGSYALGAHGWVKAGRNDHGPLQADNPFSTTWLILPRIGNLVASLERQRELNVTTFNNVFFKVTVIFLSRCIIKILIHGLNLLSQIILMIE